MDEIRETQTQPHEEYTEPKIVDHGDLRELTSKQKGPFTDVPLGGPVGPSMSQP